MKKKVVPLICEGVSDLIALEKYLDDLFADKEIKFVVSSGDILGDENNESEYLDDLIRQTIFSSHPDFALEDIYSIAHLIDMDGIFESDDIIELNQNIDTTYYDNKKIIVSKDVSKTIKTRHIRRERIIEYINKGIVNIDNRKIKYKIFYMSTNLEHVTCGNRNIKAKEKLHVATNFAYQFNSKEFLNFLETNNASCTNDYYKSWDYIKKHSLDKATNLIILIKMLLNDSLD